MPTKRPSTNSFHHSEQSFSHETPSSTSTSSSELASVSRKKPKEKISAPSGKSSLPTASEMERIGALFRKKREEMKLNLKECENSTSIRAAFLQAIEEGKIYEFISGVYAVGFIKQYAQFLGFEVESLIKEFPQALLARRENHEFSYGIGTLEMRGSLGGGVKWLPNLLWALGITTIIVLAYYFAKAVGAL